MKNIWHKYKWPLLVLFNLLPFLLNAFIFITGCMDDLLLFLPIFGALTLLNFRNCSKALPFLAFQISLLILTVASGYISTMLHYRNLVGDHMTLLVGELVVLLEAAVVIVVTAVTAIIKGRKNTK